MGKFYDDVKSGIKFYPRHGIGGRNLGDPGSGCVLMAAESARLGRAMIYTNHPSYCDAANAYGWTRDEKMDCQNCTTRPNLDAATMAWHLNDCHRWDRLEIAAFIEENFVGKLAEEPTMVEDESLCPAV